MTTSSSTDAPSLRERREPGFVHPLSGCPRFCEWHIDVDHGIVHSSGDRLIAGFTLAVEVGIGPDGKELPDVPLSIRIGDNVYSLREIRDLQMALGGALFDAELFDDTVRAVFDGGRLGDSARLALAFDELNHEAHLSCSWRKASGS